LAEKLFVYKVEDSETGEIYDVEGPEGATADELGEFVLSQNLGQSSPAPAQQVAPTQQQAPAIRAPGVDKSTATMALPDTYNNVTRSLETVPGAQDYINKAFFGNKSFGELQRGWAEMSAPGQPFEGIPLGPTTPAVWAEARRRYATNPTDKQFYDTYGVAAPVNRPTGVADEKTPDSMLGEFGNAAVRSASNMANSTIGLTAQAADIVGADETAEALLDGYLYNQAAINQTYPSGAKNVVDIRSFGDAGMKAAAILGELTPQLASSVGFGLIGTAAAKKIAMSTVEQSVIDLVESGIQKEIAEQMVLKTVQAKAARGAIAGTTASSVAQSSGSIYGDTYGANGERSPWLSLFAGTAAGSLDAILPAIVAKRLGLNGAVADTAIAQSLVKKVGKDAASAFLMEGGTEALQTIIENLPAGKSINWDSVVEAALSGGFGGSVAGGASSAYEGSVQNKALAQAAPPKNAFEGDPISVPTTRGKRDGKKYLGQIDKTQNEVVARVDQLTQTWENKPVFEVYKNFNDVDGIPNDTVGVYRDGKVYLNTEAIVAEAKQRDVTPDDIVSSVTYHEALGHYGLTQQFGDALDTTLSKILANSTIYQQRVNNWMAKNPNAYPGRDNRDILALEEILAERSEKGHMPASIINIFKNQIKDFGRRMGLDLQYSTREVETILGMAHAAVVKGPARDVRDNGYRTMYAGVNAANPPKTWLGMRDEKRWFSGPDGLARFEFSDANAKLFEDDLKRLAGTATYLPAVLEHKELFKQYPQLRDTRIVMRDMAPGFLGSYDPSKNLIAVSTTNPDKLGTILHEIQHNIQEIEGFAKGGNSETAVDSLNPEMTLRAGKNLLDYNKKKTQQLAVEVGAIAAARDMPEGRQVIENAAVAREIYAEMDARERFLQEESEKFNFGNRLTRDDLLQDFEYNKLNEEYRSFFLGVQEVGRKALRTALFPQGYFQASKQDQQEWGDLKYALEAGPEYMATKEQDLYEAEQQLGYLEEDIQNNKTDFIKIQLKKDENLNFQAYESLLGEVEARDTQARQYMTDAERAETPAYTSQNDTVPADNYVISGVVKPDDAETVQLREAYDLADAAVVAAEAEYTEAAQEFADILAEANAANRSTADGYLATPDGQKVTKHPSKARETAAIRALHDARNARYEAKAALDAKLNASAVKLSQENPNDKYMRMSSPDKVLYTEDEISAMTPEELFDSENALNILNGMMEGYTPTVMSLDELKGEVEARGLSPSKIIRKNGIGAGELVKRLQMYDIAMIKMNERLSTLWEKTQTGKFTMADKDAYLRGLFKRDEMAARIFEDQSEIARALASYKSLVYTRRRVKGMQETLLQFKEGTPYASLNDPEVFYKFASQIQAEIEANKQKAKDAGKEYLGNALNLPRALMSSMDLSAPLRQGIFLIHKAAWWRSFFQMFRYAGDQKAFDDLMEGIAGSNMYSLMVDSKLALSNMGSKLSAREEDFMSTWAEKLPVVGRFVRGSERAYVGFLNKLRADVFTELVTKLGDNYTEKDLTDIAGFINAASGRGNMPEALNKAAPVLNSLFFSPRLMASRLKMTTALIDPRTYITMSKTARNEYIKSILTVGGLALLINTLASMGGAETEEDPRASDFGKLKFGNTRYDILGGEGQYITLAARIAADSYKTTDGEVKPYGTKFGQTNRLDAIGKFLTNKAAPIPSFVMDYFRGTDAVGKKFEMDSAVMSRFVPMYLADMQENMAEEGIPTGLAMSVPGLFGVGTQTYAPASTQTDEKLEAPDEFNMVDAVDGDYPFATAKDGKITLKPGAKEEWASRQNFYYKEWMKDEMAKPTWKKLDNKAKKDIIKDVRADARKEAKADMLELLQIQEGE